MTSWFTNTFLPPKADISVHFNAPYTTQSIDNVPSLSVYSNGDIVNGTVTIDIKPGTSIPHNGIYVECIGEINTLHNDSITTTPSSTITTSKKHTSTGDQFCLQKKLLCSSDILLVSRTYEFLFKNMDMEQSSYTGTNIELIYYVRVYIQLKNNSLIEYKQLYRVENTCDIQSIPNSGPEPPVSMEVGIEDCLHLEFNYYKTQYYLNDIFIGKIQFLLNKIKIKYMELLLIRKEIILQSNKIDMHNIVKYELMCGNPVKNEIIPIRIFFHNYINQLTATVHNNHVFNVKYMINLVIIDDDDRRYFKQTEIILLRKSIEHIKNDSYIK